MGSHESAAMNFDSNEGFWWRGGVTLSVILRLGRHSDLNMHFGLGDLQSKEKTCNTVKTTLYIKKQTNLENY